MDVERTLPTTDTTLTWLLYSFVLLTTVLAVAHHLDHVVRGNHVGWPLTSDVNWFTFSLLVYPLLAVSLYLTLSRRVAAGYWAVYFALSGGMLAYFHISPWAVEPPQDVIGPYSNPAFGYLAFVVLLALIASVVVATLYGTVLWYRDGARPAN
jgi:hypothetical protein